MNVQIITREYVEANGSAPTPGQLGTWKFENAKNARVTTYTNVSYEQAEAKLREKAGMKRIYYFLLAN